jgi:hypothetical protein
MSGISISEVGAGSSAASSESDCSAATAFLLSVLRGGDVVIQWIIARDILGTKMFHDFLQASTFLDQLKCRLWTNTFNGFQIVTAEENAKFDELQINKIRTPIRLQHILT